MVGKVRCLKGLGITMKTVRQFEISTGNLSETTLGNERNKLRDIR